MSAGVFAVNGKYQADGGLVHPIRVQPETITTANALPAGAVTNSISARVGGSRRTLGLHARGVRLRFPATGAPEGYKPLGSTFVPILTPAAFTAIAGKGAEFEYLGVTCTVLGKVPEVVR